MLLAVWHSFLAILFTVSLFVSFGYLVRSSQPPNKALQLTINPLRSLIHLRKPFRAPPTTAQGGNTEDRQRGRGSEMMTFRPGRVCRLRAVWL